MVLCTPEKVYWGWKSEVKPIPVLRGNGKNSPSSKGLEKGRKTNYTFFSNILEALINEIIYSSQQFLDILFLFLHTFASEFFGIN